MDLDREKIHVDDGMLVVARPGEEVIDVTLGVET